LRCNVALRFLAAGGTEARYFGVLTAKNGVILLRPAKWVHPSAAGFKTAAGLGGGSCRRPPTHRPQRSHSTSAGMAEVGKSKVKLAKKAHSMSEIGTSIVFQPVLLATYCHPTAASPRCFENIESVSARASMLGTRAPSQASVEMAIQHVASMNPVLTTRQMKLAFREPGPTN
jgi:hypothetical protein